MKHKTILVRIKLKTWRKMLHDCPKSRDESRAAYFERVIELDPKS